MFKINKKGQGALEYLLLIGGAVLIAVIVIALLVGMGGQSRETAQDQATKAQQALEQPQPATIISVKTGDCTASGDGNITINWQELGEGGIHKLYVYNYSGDPLDLQVGANSYTTADNQLTDSPISVAVDMSAGGACQDTYWAEITTNKNGQEVKSTQMKFNW